MAEQTRWQRFPGAASMVLAGALWLVWPNLAGAAPAVQNPAATLFNVLRFVHWDASGSDVRRSVLVLCADRAADLRPDLETLRNRNVRGRRLVLHWLHSLERLDGCNALYVDSGNVSRIDAIAAQAIKDHVLTIAASSGLAGSGIMVNMVRSVDGLQLEINPRAAKAAGIELSSELLKVGTVLDYRE
ncbi:MAG: YfiR family protein [Gammaproteobacteria bacterium]|jgi:hypothetical protein